MTRIQAMWGALWAGHKLFKSATWKDRGAFLAAFTPLFYWVFQFAAHKGWIGEVSPEQVEALGAAVWTIVSFVLAYWFRATSATVGWEGKEPRVTQGGNSAGILSGGVRMQLNHLEQEGDSVQPADYPTNKS